MNQFAQPIRIMIDMETTSTEPHAGILTLGAVQFGHGVDVDSSQHFYQRSNPIKVEQAGFHCAKEVMAWWDTQDDSIREEAWTGSLAPDDLLHLFEAWVDTNWPGQKENIEIWSNGADFDCVILRNAFYHMFGNYPFNFRNHRCYRTLRSMMPADILRLAENSRVQIKKHHALEDAKYQAMVANVGLNTMMWRT